MHRLTQPRKQLSNFKLYLEGHLALEPPYVEPSPSPDSSVRSMSPSDCIPMDSDHLITPPEDDKAISKQRTTAKASLPSSDTGCMDSMLILNHGSKSRETGVELGSSTQLPTSISVAATSMERYLTPSLDATTQPEGPLTAAAQLKSDVNYSRGSEEIQLSQRRTNTRAEKKSETSWAKPFRVTKSTSRTATLRSSPRFGRLSDLEKDHSTSRRRQSRRSHGSLVNYSNNSKDLYSLITQESQFTLI